MIGLVQNPGLSSKCVRQDTDHLTVWVCHDSVRLWTIDDKSSTASIASKATVCCVRYSPNDSLLAFSSAGTLPSRTYIYTTGRPSLTVRLRQRRPPRALLRSEEPQDSVRHPA